uniref:Putative conserved secreted protein n=1 Tax=Anopheles darlingi TaxID=43151 RepID=A0A2M4CIN6_ANODA
MKSLFAVVLFVACASQVYSACTSRLLAYQVPSTVHHYEYVENSVPSVKHLQPLITIPACGCKTHTPSLYPCPYRRHGPYV